MWSFSGEKKTVFNALMYPFCFSHLLDLGSQKCFRGLSSSVLELKLSISDLEILDLDVGSRFNPKIQPIPYRWLGCLCKCGCVECLLCNALDEINLNLNICIRCLHVAEIMQNGHLKECSWAATAYSTLL